MRIPAFSSRYENSASSAPYFIFSSNSPNVENKFFFMAQFPTARWLVNPFVETFHIFSNPSDPPPGNPNAEMQSPRKLDGGILVPPVVATTSLFSSTGATNDFNQFSCTQQSSSMKTMISPRACFIP